jgi:hypothetical protein
MAHERPRVDDHVYVRERDEMGFQPLGRVLVVDRETDEVVVLFFGGPGIKYPPMAAVLEPQWFRGGGDVESYDLDMFDGAWSSHDGGDGEWKI